MVVVDKPILIRRMKSPIKLLLPCLQIFLNILKKNAATIDISSILMVNGHTE